MEHHTPVTLGRTPTTVPFPTDTQCPTDNRTTDQWKPGLVGEEVVLPVDSRCKFCDSKTDHGIACNRIKEVEFFENGDVKRVEYHW